MDTTLVPGQKQRRKPKKTNHAWTPQERKILADNSSLSPSQIKKRFFSSDRTIQPKGISMQQYNLRNGIVKVDQPPRSSKNGSLKNSSPSVVAGQFEIEVAYTGFKAHEKEIKEFNSQLTKAINHSPYSKTSREYLLNALASASLLEATEKQLELVKSIQA